jgi:hypothetical protein
VQYKMCLFLVQNVFSGGAGIYYITVKHLSIVSEGTVCKQ